MTMKFTTALSVLFVASAAAFAPAAVPSTSSSTVRKRNLVCEVNEGRKSNKEKKEKGTLGAQEADGMVAMVGWRERNPQLALSWASHY